MILPFFKYQGAGNDFILIDDRLSAFPAENHALIQKLCCRKFGIGADGLILLCLDPQADFLMRIFNSDGCEAGSCGNGLRCLVRFLQELGLPDRRVRIRTGDRIAECFLDGGRPVVDMGAPREVRLRLDTGAGEVHFADTGVPHAVRFVPDVETVDLHQAGRLLRHHPLFAPEGANADFAAIQPDGSIRVRTFERGVEGETLACGTGAAAVGTIARRLFGLKMPIYLHFSGGTLEVWEEGERLFVAGPAEKVFAGIVGYPL